MQNGFMGKRMHDSYIDLQKRVADMRPAAWNWAGAILAGVLFAGLSLWMPWWALVAAFVVLAAIIVVERECGFLTGVTYSALSWRQAIEAAEVHKRRGDGDL